MKRTLSIFLLLAAFALVHGASSSTAAEGTVASAKATTTVKATPAAEKAKPKLPIIPDTKEALEVKLATVKLFYDAGAAAIVDARDADEYAAGHIMGAVSLPFDGASRDESLVKKFDSSGKPIIIYCGGGECELSKNLASMMIETGHKKVLVYTGGFPEWSKAGYPVSKAAAAAATTTAK